MIVSVFFNFVTARAIFDARETGNETRRKRLTVFAVAVNLFILAFFKYVPWLAGLFESAVDIHLPLPYLALPVGISFYTFQELSYVLDVSRGKASVQRNYFTLLLYISFFPQLIAGPIVTYEAIREQLTERTVTVEKTALGVRRFLYGLSKKLLISNTAALIADAAFASSAPSLSLAWAGAVCYSLQIYFDFSGYSDMAIGLASMFGFSLAENFNYPYSAVTVRDFWKRWHISLTNWFREYVYIPLGGNRVSGARTVLNRYIIFFLTGFWHGANFTYILWGLWHGTLMMFERLVHMERLEKKRILHLPLRLYTLLTVVLGFVMFRAPSVTAGFRFIGSMFSASGTPSSDVTGLLSPYVIFMLFCGVILSFPLLALLRTFFEKIHAGMIFDVFEYILCIPLFFLCVMTLASTSFNPFIYYIF
ncbi:MAG: MBOAT family protein [Clostridia bacterium]|nr:MBOAT family protein [Clostridia bacterium]